MGTHTMRVCEEWRRGNKNEPAETNHDLYPVDLPNTACPALSARWRYEADRPSPGAASADADPNAGSVRALHRFRGGSRCSWPDPARPLAHSADVDPAGSLWAGHRNDLRDHLHSHTRSGRRGCAPTGARPAPRGRRLRTSLLGHTVAGRPRWTHWHTEAHVIAGSA